MDIASSLKSAENAIRDVIAYVLLKKYGAGWAQKSGVSVDRLNKWNEKKSVEENKLGHVDPRIIYYADFYDLITIITKNWDCGLGDVFKNKKETDVLLGILSDFRNPEAHHRELMPYEKQLSMGISGKIRTNISEYFSKMETGKSYYPRLESVQDNFGNSWALGENNPLKTSLTLRPGDVIEYSVTGNDPLGQDIEYAAAPNAVPRKLEWKRTGEFSIILDSSHVGDVLWVHIGVRSKREYHARGDVVLGKVDDAVCFGYEVLPPIGFGGI